MIINITSKDICVRFSIIFSIGFSSSLWPTRKFAVLESWVNLSRHSGRGVSSSCRAAEARKRKPGQQWAVAVERLNGFPQFGQKARKMKKKRKKKKRKKRGGGGGGEGEKNKKQEKIKIKNNKKSKEKKRSKKMF